MFNRLGWVVKTDEYGCVVPGCQLGIEESELIADISIYPNPASRITNIYLKSNDLGLRGELLVRDAMGKIIRQEKTLGGDINIAMDVSDLQAGIYLVEFSCDSQRTVIQKLVVE